MTEVATLSFNKRWPQWESRLIRSRNSQPVSAGFSSAVLFICSMWSCHLLIDTLLTECVCVCVYFHAPRTTHIQHFIPVDFIMSRVVTEKQCHLAVYLIAFSQPSGRSRQQPVGVSFTCRRCHQLRCFSFIQFLSDLCFRPFAFLPTCRSENAFARWNVFAFPSFLSARAFVLYSVCLFISMLYFSFSLTFQ